MFNVLHPCVIYLLTIPHTMNQLQQKPWGGDKFGKVAHEMAWNCNMTNTWHHGDNNEWEVVTNYKIFD
jgi:hypothetical protein